MAELKSSLYGSSSLSTRTVYIHASLTPWYNVCARRAAPSLIGREIRDAGYWLRDLKNGVGLAIGRGFHAGIAASLITKMRTGELGPEDEANDIAVEAYRESKQETDGLEYDQISGPRNAEQHMVGMMRSYRVHAAPKVFPVSVESRTEVELRPGFVVTGRKDMLAAEPHALTDWKTGRSLGVYIAQLGTYDLLEEHENGRRVEALNLDFMRRLSRAQPPPVRFAYDPDGAREEARATVHAIARDVAEFRRRVEEGYAPPHTAFRANPNTFLCDPRFCRAWGTNWCRVHPARPQHRED